MTKDLTKPTLDDLIALLDEKYTLVYPDYDDKLSDEQIKAIFDTGEETEDYYEWRDEVAYVSAQEVIKQLCEDNDIEQDDLDGDTLDALRIEIEDRDDSKDFDKLLSNAGRKWLRYRIGDGDEIDTWINGWSSTEEERHEFVVQVCTFLSIEVAPNEPIIQAMLNEVGNGGGIYLYWHGGIDTLVKACFDDETPRTITWDEGVGLLVFNQFEGSGFNSDPLIGKVTLPFDRSMLRLDQGDGSFADWTCGGMYSNNDIDVTITEVTDA